ncbi:hypothetical protein M7I_4275 [Glarea lozoyensis 74030]|uniref:NAD(P)-binding domain-containing protein n=1 Tax=Glarea lozoyensis (strain ATCC 74030 / MF5533) TaxID=1104152 RepID=H0ENR2_GLAL7|nr:hypothetical protein M7I_4275 [Glarea lozoyensis 74030]
MKVLLLGLTGNVGSRLLPSLLAHNHSVVAFVRSPSKIPSEIKSKLAALVVGSATDSNAIRTAILEHECDAVVNAAGVAAMTGFTAQGEFTAIFEAVVKVCSEAGKERGVPIRCWFMSGFGILDGPKKGCLLSDFIPLFPSHKRNYALIKSIPPSTLAWSLFCAMEMPPKHPSPQFPPSPDSPADNLIAKADSPPNWNEKWKKTMK